MKEITINELLKLNDYELIDVRNKQMFNEGHIPGSVNIPLIGILTNYEALLDKTKHYYIICNAGLNSSIACEKLLESGYDVTNVIDGYSAYQK